MVELVDTQDLKSCLQQCKCGFNSHPEYKAVQLSGFFVYHVFLPRRHKEFTLRTRRRPAETEGDNLLAAVRSIAV